MKKRKTFEIKQTAKWLLCLVLTGFALASCSNENDESGVVIEIPTMDDPITDVSAWIFNADNTLKHYYDFSKLEDMPLKVFDLPSGSYKMVAATNLNNAFSHNTSMSELTLADLLITMDDPSASPAHAHYGVAEVQVTEGRINKTEIALNRAMAEMSFTIQSIPEEVVSAELKVLNSSKGYYPGVNLLHSDIVTVEYGKAVPTNGEVSFEQKNIMPIVAMPLRADDEVKTRLQLTMFYTNGGTLTFDLETPLLQSGGTYTPKIEYAILRTGITIEINEINGWVELPPIHGEILNPTK